jgi:hypothetical protein
MLVPGVEPRRLPIFEGWYAGCMARELCATFSLGIMPGASEWSDCRKHHDSREQWSAPWLGLVLVVPPRVPLLASSCSWIAAHMPLRDVM